MSSVGTFTPMELVRESFKALPEEWKRRPYGHPDLNHGVNLLQTEQALDAYMAAYGEMHIMKLRAALQNFPYHHLLGPVEIVDWGCGQGLGSLVCLEALAQHKIDNVCRVSLIEPSESALQRAVDNVGRVFNNHIMPYPNYLPQANRQGCIGHIDYVAQNVIHVFSNILDVTNFDLMRLAKLVNVPGKRHFVICVSPANKGAEQMTLFALLFPEREQFSNIQDANFLCTSDTHYSYSCKTNCFEITSKELGTVELSQVESLFAEPCYNDYDMRLARENKVVNAAHMQLYKILEKQLNDDDVIFIRPDINGDKPDIVVLRPNKGILLIKMFYKDILQYSLSPIPNETPDKAPNKKEVMGIKDNESGELYLSPVEQISALANSLIKEHMECLHAKVMDNAKNMSLVKKLVVFTKNSQEQVPDFFKNTPFVTVLGREFFEDKSQQNSLLDILRFNYNNTDFDDATYRSFIDILSPKWHAYSQGEEIKMTAVQRKLSESRKGARQKIRGVAGSGKTQVLVERAIKAQVRTGGTVLILTYNKTLVNYIRYRMNKVRADFLWNKFFITHYHDLFHKQAKYLGLCGIGRSSDIHFFEQKKELVRKFDAIFVDEIQDYTNEWITIVYKYFLKEGGEFVVFGDPKQNVYHRPLDKSGDISISVIGGLWNKELKKAVRCTSVKLAKLSMRFQETFLNGADETEWNDVNEFDFDDDSQLHYVKLDSANCDEPSGLLTQKIIEITAHRQLRDIVVLAQKVEILRDIEAHYRNATRKETETTFCQKEQRYHILECSQPNHAQSDIDRVDDFRKKSFKMRDDVVRFSTVHSFKGWEADTVILVMTDVENSVMNHHLYYTALTRAKRNLYVFSLGNDQYDNVFNEIIGESIQQPKR